MCMYLGKAKLSIVYADALCRCPEHCRASSSAGGALCDICQKQLICSCLSLRAELHDDWLVALFFFLKKKK